LGYKLPVSALVVVYTPALRVLLLERADYPDHWQSVTGGKEPRETLQETAVRELREETGVDAKAFGGVVDWHKQNVYEIFPRWKSRYPPGTTHNTEHVFSLEVPSPIDVILSPREHVRHEWLPWEDAARKCFSWSNRAAIEELPRRVAASNGRTR
jgi:dATP pyrophosphohydrolase